MRPDDVYVSYSGQSVEIKNTDAEGRLVLGDAVFHASQYAPSLIMDFATLTGAVVAALGTERTGVFTNKKSSYIADLTNHVENGGVNVIPGEVALRESMWAAYRCSDEDVTEEGATQYEEGDEATHYDLYHFQKSRLSPGIWQMRSSQLIMERRSLDHAVDHADHRECKNDD